MKSVLVSRLKSSREAQLIVRWSRMIAGRSYWHLPQGLGRSYRPGQLVGYFNDLTLKASFPGIVCERGLPLNRVGGGPLVHVPTTVVQFALGHYDCYLATHDDDHLRLALAGAQWAVETQDNNGGWPIWPILGLACPSPYSAMTQGETISLLVRAFAATSDRRFLSAARSGLGPLISPIEAGGTSRPSASGLVLEEVPAIPPVTILNGWIFALFGLEDLRIADPDDQHVADSLADSLRALVAMLPGYDTGWWSSYDLSGTIASPFYHRLHIAQLRAMELAFPQLAGDIATTRGHFERELVSVRGRSRAIIVKGWQKVTSPPRVVVS
jgi:heparosan-N-sulfate-glucuronate 5-epimerase